MTKMINCDGCSAYISAKENACPKCGHKNKRAKHLTSDQILVLFILCVIAPIIYLIPESTEQPEPVEKEAIQENPNCHKEIQCWGDKHLYLATTLCRPHVERLASYSFEWTDGWLDTKLSRFRWKNISNKQITYIGDKIKFQNGFGAYQNHMYECDFDPTTETVLDVRAMPGFIPVD